MHRQDSAPSPTSLLHQLPLGNTLSSGQGQARITCIPSVCPHNDGNVLAAEAFTDYFSGAGSCMNSAVHVPPSPLSACAPLHRKADFSPNLAVTEPLPWPWVGAQLTGTHTQRSCCPGTQITAWHTQHCSQQLKHCPATPGCAGSSIGKLCLASRRSSKHSFQALGGQILPRVGTATQILTFQRAKAVCCWASQRQHVALYPGRLRCHGTSQEAIEAW